jgi:hypothetical protein
MQRYFATFSKVALARDTHHAFVRKAYTTLDSVQLQQRRKLEATARTVTVLQETGRCSSGKWKRALQRQQAQDVAGNSVGAQAIGSKRGLECRRTGAGLQQHRLNSPPHARHAAEASSSCARPSRRLRMLRAASEAQLPWRLRFMIVVCTSRWRAEASRGFPSLKKMSSSNCHRPLLKSILQKPQLILLSRTRMNHQRASKTMPLRRCDDPAASGSCRTFAGSPVEWLTALCRTEASLRAKLGAVTSSHRRRRCGGCRIAATIRPRAKATAHSPGVQWNG